MLHSYELVFFAKPTKFLLDLFLRSRRCFSALESGLGGGVDDFIQLVGVKGNVLKISVAGLDKKVLHF
jgi:hypothetical protein